MKTKGIREEFKTTEVQIAFEKNKIYYHPEGDMMFRDHFVPGVKLKDLLGIIHMIKNYEGGTEDCTEGQREYLIEHENESLADPVVSLIIPDGDSGVSVLGVFDVQPKSFRVVLSKSALNSDYKIVWQRGGGLLGEIIFDPAITTSILQNQWHSYPNSNLFFYEIEHNLNIDIQNYIVDIYDINGNKVTVNKLEKYANKLLVESTVNTDLSVIIKRIK